MVETADSPSLQVLHLTSVATDTGSVCLRDSWRRQTSWEEGGRLIPDEVDEVDTEGQTKLVGSLVPSSGCMLISSQQ